MRCVPLKEYSNPRILLIDFDKKDVAKVVDAGFEVKRAYSGLYDNQEFCIPCEIQDIEICLVKISEDTFKNIKERHNSKDSYCDAFVPHVILKEIWYKHGWTIVFVKKGTCPDDLQYLGIDGMGYMKFRDQLISPTREMRMSFGLSPYFPIFRGETVNRKEGVLGDLLIRYFQSGEWILFTKDHKVEFSSLYPDQEWPILDNSAVSNSLSVILYDKFMTEPEKARMTTPALEKVEVSLPQYSYGGILVLPDFGNNDIELGINLINEYVYTANPLLFSTPKHEWLAGYRPASVNLLFSEIEKIERDSKREIEYTMNKIEEEEKTYSWLRLLLVGMDDEFKQAVSEAFKFIGYKVEDIDEKLGDGERKKEDLHITDPITGSFYLVEAKSTKRGASEDLIAKTQNHQGNYSRQHNCKIPNAILVINHSVDLEPKKRGSRFYKDPAILGRLRDQGIKAIDSVALHSLCQIIIEDAGNRERVRLRIENESGIISPEIS